MVQKLVCVSCFSEPYAARMFCGPIVSSDNAARSCLGCEGCQSTCSWAQWRLSVLVFDIFRHSLDFKFGFPVFRKHSHQENEGLVSQEILCVADAAQCLVELAGPIRIDLDLFLELGCFSPWDRVADIGRTISSISLLQRMKWTICCALDS